MISVEGLKVEFGVKPLFHDVSFVINDLYGFHFATLLLKFPDYDNYELEAPITPKTLNGFKDL